MKRIIILATVVAIVFACKKKETPTPIAKLAWDATTLADSGVLGFNENIRFKTNYDKAIYTVSRGSINDSGRYIVPATQGKVVVLVKNPADPNDSIKRTFFVSQYKSLFNQMKSGGYALSFRHGDASSGSDNFTSTTPQWWKSCSSTEARQLTPVVGPLQCTELGLAMKLHNLPVRRLFTSEYCRCKGTAELFALPNVAVTQNQDITYYVYNEANRYQLQMNLIGAQPIDNSNTVLVGHAGFGNVPTAYNGVLNQLAWGDAALFQLNSTNSPTYITTIAQGTLRGMLY